jgi:hypothetical protein
MGMSGSTDTRVPRLNNRRAAAFGSPLRDAFARVA